MLCYASSLRGDFVFDDQQIVSQNSQILNIRTFNDVIALAGGFRELLFFTYGLNYYWSGMNTFSYHAVNVLLHAINVLLVYGIVLAAAPTLRFPAFAGAAIFAVHSLFSSAVSYIAGRSSVLCGTFYFLAILLFFKALDSTRWRVRVAYFTSTGVAGWLAWQAKQEAIALPLFLAVVVFLQSEKKDWRWIAGLSAIPLVLLVLTWKEITALYGYVTGNQILVNAGFEQVLPLATYVRTYAASVVGYYLPRFVFPADLSADPQIDPIEYWSSPEFIFSMFALATLVWLTIRLYKRQPLFSLGVAALLVSPLLAYAAIPLADVVLEHRAYIPGLGVAFLFAWAFHWVEREYSKVRWLALSAIVGILVFMTASRNAVWANSVALWEDAVAKAPKKVRAHFNLGQAYQAEQRSADAIREYEQALALKPDIHAAYSNLAAMYLEQGQYDKAEETLLRITSIAPDFTEGFINLGVLYIRRQEPDKAIRALDRALEINPRSFVGLFNRGEAFGQKGDFKSALENYRKAVELRPDIDAFRLSLGVAYSRAGDRAAAEREFHALTKGPIAPQAYRNLGVLYMSGGEHMEQAIEYLQQALRLQNVYPDAHHDLGVVYLQKKMMNEAMEEFRTTLAQQPGNGPATINLALAYQMKGDSETARQTLESWLQQYGGSNSPYVEQVRARLGQLK